MTRGRGAWWPRRADRSASRADEALADEALAAIVRSSPDAVIAKTVRGVITAWNAGATAVYGYPAEEAIGSDIARMFPADEVAQEQLRHQRVAAGEPESGYRCRRIRADGSIIEVVMSMTPVRDRSGAVTGIASISRPVSAREEMESRIVSVLEAAPDGMICTDRNGCITMANDRAGEMFGYLPGALLGQPIEVLVPEALRAAHVRHRDGYSAHPVRRQLGPELALSGRRRDGSTFPVEVSLAFDGSGPDAVVIAAVRDVTAQRRAETALRTSETQLRQLAEHVDTVFVLRQLDPPSYLYVSPAFERVTGWPAAVLDAGAATLLDMVHPDDREVVATHYLHEAGLGRPAQSEHRIVGRDGVVRWVRVFSAPVANPRGAVERTVVTIEDITARVEASLAARRSEAVANEANAAKTVFLSRMSHELRTPLNAILGFAQLLDRQLTDDRFRPSVGQILTAGRHLHDLISEVLDISRIESGDLAVALEPVDAAAVAREALALLGPMAVDLGVTLHAPPAGPPVWLTADRQRLMQVLLNLVSNAVKYNHWGGTVRVDITAVGSQVGIGVRDDGNGIPAHRQQRLFTPFDRLGAEASGVEGTGVGLAVTRSLVTVMGGSIAVHSVDGAGSTFTVTFPAAVGPAASVPAPRPVVRDTPRPAAGPSVLLYVEDNEPNVRLMESVLALRPGWTMRHAGTAAAGARIVSTEHVDVVFLDMHLPDGLGIDVLRDLKGTTATATVPVVMLSADADRELPVRIRAAGAVDFLTKPLDIDTVLALLDRWGDPTG